MPLLNFETPKKVRPVGQSGPFEPNMSDADRDTYKAKWLRKGHADERIEIRKTFNGTQVVAVVFDKPDVRYIRGLAISEHLDVQLSANGKMDFTWDQWNELDKAVREAKNLLNSAAYALSGGTCMTEPAKYYPIEDQVNDCFAFLGKAMPDAHGMTEQELADAETWLSGQFTWANRPGFVQAVPVHVATGTVIVPSGPDKNPGCDDRKEKT